jgi:hypothetical protein
MTQRTELRPVDRGVALLDQRWPDWWKNVDLDDFRLNDPENCVLAHAFPECNYNETVMNLSGIKEPDVPYFINDNLMAGGPHPEWFKFAEELTLWEHDYGFAGDSTVEWAWKDLIRFRQMHADQGGVMW